ncbi:DNA-binding domain-containing protein [Marinifilum sp.]|uniref:DNA-binding domain-containing protein n=1 Tax=Marinifilum sp. TaxID=2033137 RepID=UPI003BACC49C
MYYYTLYDNKLTQDNPDDCMAKSVNSVVKTEEDLFKSLTAPGSILKDVEVKAVKSEIWKTIISFLEEGYGYRDENISIRLDISGKFEDKDDRFDPDRHKVNISIVPGKSLKKACKEIKPQFVKATSVKPEIESVYDWISDTSDDVLSPGGTLEISGEDLKIYTQPTGQGVFFINKSNGQETLAAMPRMNEPKMLSLRVPELVAGTYRIEIRNSARNAKKLRVGTTPTEFTVK